MIDYRHQRRLEKLKASFAAAGIRPLTKLGQNFLLDRNQVNYIARTGAVGPDDVVLEVGPGTGFLTRELAATGALVLAVELDRKLIEVARAETADFPNVFFIGGDILAGKYGLNPAVPEKLAELMALKGPRASLKSVSNLPYSAGTPFCANLFGSPLPWATAVFLIQYEVAQRLLAGPGDEEYGGLSISRALATTAAKLERKVPPQVFWPRPRVDSAVIRLEFKPPAERTGLPWRQLRRLTMAAFAARRKSLRNALCSLAERETLEAAIAAAGLSPEARAPTLSPEDYLRLAQQLPPPPEPERKRKNRNSEPDEAEGEADADA